MSFRPGQAKGASVTAGGGGGLVSVAVADTATIDMSGDGTPGNPVEADAIIDPDPSNQLTSTPAGLFVPPPTLPGDQLYELTDNASLLAFLNDTPPAGEETKYAIWKPTGTALTIPSTTINGRCVILPATEISLFVPDAGATLTAPVAGDGLFVYASLTNLLATPGPARVVTLGAGCKFFVRKLGGAANVSFTAGAGDAQYQESSIAAPGAIQAWWDDSMQGGGGSAIYEITDFATWIAFLAAAPGVNGQKTGVVLVDTIVNGAAGSYPVNGRCNVLCAYDLAFVTGTGNVQHTGAGEVYFYPSIVRWRDGLAGGTTELTTNVNFYVRKIWNGSAGLWATSAGVLYYQSAAPGNPSIPALASQNWWDEAQQSDQMVKVTSADTTADYLGSKVIAGPGISLSTLNPGGNEDLQITSSGSGEGFISLFTFNIGNPGSAQSGIGTNFVQAVKCIAQASGTVNQIGFFAASGGASPVYGAIYADGDTGALLGEASWATTAAGLNWAALSANVSVVAGQVYWLALKDSNSATNFLTGSVPATGTPISKNFFHGPAGMPATLTPGASSTTTIQVAARRV